jgi:SAM-dependent methyltransferase
MFEQVRPATGDECVEVGPGIGTFTERLLDVGVTRLLLIEPDSELAGVLGERFGRDPRVTVAPESVPGSPTLARRSGEWDFVLCQNVLEHVRDDAAALAEIARALRPGGRLALLVPAGPRLFGSLDRAYGHERRYTRDRLTTLIRAAGLVLADLYAFNLLGVAGWWVRSRAGATTLGRRSLRVYEALLPVWRPIERGLRPRWGLSLIAHARRPPIDRLGASRPDPKAHQ